MTNAELGRAAPVVSVSRMSASVDFYRRAFGLELAFKNGDSYAVLKCGGAEIHLTVCSDPRPREQNVMHLIVGDAKAIHDSCVAAGGTVVEALRDAPWGMRTFVVADLDGHRVDVGQPLGDAG